jgi:hypothetical protein
MLPEWARVAEARIVRTGGADPPGPDEAVRFGLGISIDAKVPLWYLIRFSFSLVIELF